MIREFKLPELAEGVDTAVVVGISVAVGDIVVADQSVAELENSKATAEIPVPFGGKVTRIFKKVGDEIKVGETLLALEVTEAVATEAPAAPLSGAVDSARPGTVEIQATQRSVQHFAETTVADSTPELLNTVASAGADVPAGPEVRRLARELGIDLSLVTGTGPRQRITPSDVKLHARAIVAKPALTDRERQPSPASEWRPSDRQLPDFTRWGAVDEQPMSGVRRATAEVTSFSWQQIPHVTQYDEADITGFQALRSEWAQLAAQTGSRLTVTALLLKATAAALKIFPRFNCSVDMSGHKLIYKQYIHLAVAVDAGHGLLTPVIYNADQKSVFDISTELQTLSQKAKDKKLSLDEMSGSTFAVSNLGGFGTTSFGPLVTWPHVAALGVSKADIRPVWRNDAFEPRTLLPVSISYDHRANDGADAARFLRWVCEAMENPLKITMQAG